MREYIAAYEKDAIDKGGVSTEVRNWIGWARDKVNWYDPITKQERVH